MPRYRVEFSLKVREPFIRKSGQCFDGLVEYVDLPVEQAIDPLPHAKAEIQERYFGIVEVVLIHNLRKV